jgi:pimeloyl-ACP methyl ester carboxylesterase
MIAPLAKFIDWYALQFFWAIRLKSVPKWNINAEKSKLDEALQFLNGPDFIPAENHPAQVEFNGPKRFGFPTPKPCDMPVNNIAYGRLYRCAKHWQERPVIILLHGGGDFLNHRFRFPWIVPACNQAGFNAATVVAPYHFQRRARGLAEWSHLRTAHAFAQAVAEIRALTGWFLGEGCPSVALWGFSLGGWLAGLAACHDTRLASVVLTMPGVRMDYKFSRAERVVWRGVREALRAQSTPRAALDTTPLNLILSRPVIPRENILLIEGIYDLFVEREAIEELWQKWGQPDIWRLPHGHISQMAMPGLTGRVLRWLAPRLDAPTAQARSNKTAG